MSHPNVRDDDRKVADALGSPSRGIDPPATIAGAQAAGLLRLVDGPAPAVERATPPRLTLEGPGTGGPDKHGIPVRVGHVVTFDGEFGGGRVAALSGAAAVVRVMSQIGVDFGDAEIAKMTYELEVVGWALDAGPTAEAEPPAGDGRRATPPHDGLPGVGPTYDPNRVRAAADALYAEFVELEVAAARFSRLAALVFDSAGDGGGRETWSYSPEERYLVKLDRAAARHRTAAGHVVGELARAVAQERVDADPPEGPLGI